MYKARYKDIMCFKFLKKLHYTRSSTALKMSSPHRLLRLQDRRRRRRRRDAGRGVLQPPLLDLSLVALIEVSPENYIGNTIQF